MTGQLTQLQPTRQRKEPIIKPQSSGLVERCLVVGGGLSVIYTFLQTLPIASVAAVVGIGVYFWGEIKSFQPRDVSEELKRIFEARTPKHPSIKEVMPQLKKQYASADINRAIESMIGCTDMVYFGKDDKHPLAIYEEVYCWVNPDDKKDVKMPLERMEELFQRWGLMPTVDTSAKTVEVAHTEASEENEIAPSPMASTISPLPNLELPNPVAPLKDALPQITETANDLGWLDLNESGSAFAAPLHDVQKTAKQTKQHSSSVRETSFSADELSAEFLLKRLKMECPKLLLLVKAPPIRLVGHQRTGKSSFARKLVLLRKILLPGHQISWITPHMEKDNPLTPELNPCGFTMAGRKNFLAIEQRWIDIQERIDKGEHLNESAVWDEFGSYEAFDDQELLGSGLRSLLREASKHEYYPILIAHGDQASFYPGVMGVLTTLKLGTVKVETIGAPADDFGTMRPTGRVRIHDLNGNSREIEVPDWFTEEYLLAILKVQESKQELIEGYQPQPVQSPSEPTTEEPRKSILAAAAARRPDLITDEHKEAFPELKEQLKNVISINTAKGSDEGKNNEWDDAVEKYLPSVCAKRFQEESLERCWDAVTKNILEKERADLLSILWLSIEKGELKYSTVKDNFHRRNWFKHGAEMDRPSSIRALFTELESYGIGQCFGEGDRLSWTLLPPS